MKKRLFFIFSLLFIYFFTSYYRCTETLPSEIELSIDQIQQKQNRWCAHACVEMWAKYEGRSDVTQEKIALDGMFSDCWSCGMWFYQIVEAVNHYAAEAVGDFSLSYSRSSCEILLGKFVDALRDAEPTIVIYFDIDFIIPGKHAVIIKGYTKNEENNNDQLIPEIKSVIFNDPYRQEKTLNYDDFISDIMVPVTEYYTEQERLLGRMTTGLFYIVGTSTRSYADRTMNAKQGYQEFLNRCGTYYGGPEIYIPEGSTFVRVRYPLGSETLAYGRNEQIKWESNSLSGQIKLQLYKNDILKGTIAQNLPIGNGSYNWTAGQYLGGSVQTGENYRIKVSMMDNSYDDFSNVYFKLGSVTVNTPNGGETWEQGSLRYIAWDSSYFTGDVQLLLRKTIPGKNYFLIS